MKVTCSMIQLRFIEINNTLIVHTVNNMQRQDRRP